MRNGKTRNMELGFHVDFPVPCLLKTPVKYDENQYLRMIASLPNMELILRNNSYEPNVISTLSTDERQESAVGDLCKVWPTAENDPSA